MAPPTAINAAAEAAFMKQMMEGLDDSFFNAVPSPDVPKTRIIVGTPTKVRPPKAKATPAKTTAKRCVDLRDSDMMDLLEGADNWDWEDMESDFLTPKKPRVATPKKRKHIKPAPGYVKEKCARCIVEEISQGSDGKILLMRLDNATERRKVILRHDWMETDVRVGDVVNVLGDFTPLPELEPTSASSSRLPPTSSILVTSQKNLIILHPDLLLTATALSNAPQCRRKPLLQALVKPSVDTSPAMVWGNMLHGIMQTCLQEGQWEDEYIDGKINESVKAGLSDLVQLNVSVEFATREVKTRAKGLKAFSQRYMADKPKPDAILQDTRASNGRASVLAISALHDVEENVWSPTYGMKGKVDATVHATIAPVPPPPQPFKRNGPQQTKLVVPPSTDGPVPFEIKTGRSMAGMEHRAQTMLYTLLLSERYGTDVPEGLLYYTQSEEVVKVPRGRNEVRGLICARNEMAGYMMRRGGKSHLADKAPVEGEDVVVEPFLPPTIDDESACKRCYVVDACMLYRKAVDEVVDQDSPIADMYDLKTGHLTALQTTFFKKWEALLSHEEQDLVRFKKELWTMGAKAREAKGRCFSSMVLDTDFKPGTLPADRGSKIHQFTYRLSKSACSTQGPDSSLLNGGMGVGDPITISVEPGLLALACGFILDICPGEVIVGVDHELLPEVIASRLYTLTGDPKDLVRTVIFRVDKDELFGGMGRIRDNLAQLFYLDGDARRLELVVDLKPPVFDDEPPVLDTAAVTPGLNDNQRAAMSKVLTAKDYSLILGMPGTGKTTVIAALIRALVSMNKTVLLTSYTHSAVDTILLKLLDEDLEVLRLGNTDKVHPDVRRFTIDGKKPAASVEQLERQFMAPPVVATTCLSTGHPVFSRRRFDVCIVDEASQITLPTCLGPLRFAETFVLVGDHFQLPPLVRDRRAREGGLDVSLFRRLSDAHPHAVVDLTHQYRMSEDIMKLSNSLIYSNRLRCGSETVAKQTLVLPDPTFLRHLHPLKPCHAGGCWIEKLMDESCKAVFVDTDMIPARDSRFGDLVHNEIEAVLVQQLTETLLQSGIREDQIGILSLYRQQNKKISHLLQNRPSVEILTADKSQGRDKDCIIISMVRSNDGGHIGELVKDWRRMNVSFTRARSKLIVIGSRTTLCGAPLLETFFELMEENSWILKLPPGADRMHQHAPSKRVAEDTEAETVGSPPAKRPNRGRAASGLLKGRPILQDLVANCSD